MEYYKFKTNKYILLAPKFYIIYYHRYKRGKKKNISGQIYIPLVGWKKWQSNYF